MGIFTSRGETETRELRIDEAVHAIEVDADGARLEVTASDGDATSVDVVLTSGTGKTFPSFEHTLEGGVLRLESHLPARSPNARAEISVSAPRSAALTMTLRAGRVIVAGRDADVTLDGAAAKAEVRDIAGNVRIDVDAGTVSGSDLRGGDLTVRSAAGRVDLENLRARTVSVSADAGKVDLELMERPTTVTVRASAGAASVSLPAGSYNLITNATLGKVSASNLIHDPSADSTINVDVSVGRVKLDGVTG
jgi:DUF4097 and DUF4098 domain-containing protein YvlB